MSLDPKNFFVGLIDFFSVLLPGALLTYLVKDDVGPWFLGNNKYTALAESSRQGAVAFLFSSYLLGHFLFLLGSLLDDWVYDPIRKRTDKEQVRRLLSHRELSPGFVRWLAHVFFKKNPDEAVNRIIPIKENYLGRLKAPHAVNAFQWCKARLVVKQRDALAIVNRFEADAKFFRSFVALLVGVSGVAMYRGPRALAAASGALLLLAFWRYMEQRFKSTQQAYWTVLTLEAAESPALSTGVLAPASRKKKPIPPTHAGGVVFRRKKGGVEYLLVQAKNNTEEWVLPKGHIELGEEAQYSAVREVKEETGVWARIIAPELRPISKYKLDNKPVRVQFYLMHPVARGKRDDGWRKSRWVSYEEALKKLTRKESQNVLRQAETTRAALIVADNKS